MPLFKLKILAVGTVGAALLGCSSPSQGANDALQNGRDGLLADERYQVALRDEFLEVSGKDFVEFRKGSSVLEPGAAFRLERQALWLRAYPMVSVRLVASGDGMEQARDRRLAMARGLAVQKHLIASGVRAYQISGIDVTPSVKDSRQRVTTKIDLIQAALNE